MKMQSITANLDFLHRSANQSRSYAAWLHFWYRRNTYWAV